MGRTLCNWPLPWRKSRLPPALSLGRETLPFRQQGPSPDTAFLDFQFRVWGALEQGSQSLLAY